MDPVVSSCLNILRRTPPQDIEQNVTALSALLRDESKTEELLQRVDTPLKIAVDENAHVNESNEPSNENKKYIICDHNRDSDSYRSPWTNQYYPPFNTKGEGEDEEDGLKPSPRLRDLEIKANKIFQTYMHLYYGSGSGQAVSSVYFWDTDGEKGPSESEPLNSFAAIFLIRKDLENDCEEQLQQQKQKQSSFWNSIHVIDVKKSKTSSTETTTTCNYKVTTTMLISVVDNISDGDEEKTSIAGSLTRQIEKACAVTSDESHLENIGLLIEDTEHFMRSNMDSLYIQKTREIVECMRCFDGSFSSSSVSSSSAHQSKFVGSAHANLLNQAIMARAKANKEDE